MSPSSPAPQPAQAVEFEPPLACVRRILKTCLPASTNVGKDASAAFCRACGIFVIYITACANDFAREHKRQTITANDVLAAIKELDFDEFTPQLTSFLERYRANEKSKRDAKAKMAAARAGEPDPNGKPAKKPKLSEDEDTAAAAATLEAEAEAVEAEIAEVNAEEIPTPPAVAIPAPAGEVEATADATATTNAASSEGPEE